MDVRLVGRSLAPAGLIDKLNNRVRPGKGKGDFQVLRDTKNIRGKVGKPLWLHLVKKLRRSNRQGIYNPEVYL